jgi:hypothetical protein
MSTFTVTCICTTRTRIERKDMAGGTHHDRHVAGIMEMIEVHGNQ